MPGRLLLPGLIDAHCHVDKTLFGGRWVPHSAGPALADRIAEERRRRAELGLPDVEAAPSGTGGTPAAVTDGGGRADMRRASPDPSYTGLISFGARVADAGVPSTGGKMAMSFGKHAFFGYQVFDETSAIWFVNLPHAEPLSAAQAQQTPASEWLPLLAAKFAEDRTPAAQLINRTDPADLLVVGSMENMPRVPVWSRGRMVLVGDSAHAPSSSSGQGASLAIESAIVLARCLHDLPDDQALAG